MDELVSFIQAEIAAIAFIKVSPSESLLKSKLLDSIAIVDLLVSIEEKTGKKIPQHLITEDNFDSIDKIISIVGSI
ncbi:MAG: hypothetical protein IPN99_12345 [Bacteroidetes bacterium]|nr:hypothetical protein [Bacteroidota bacterium]